MLAAPKVIRRLLVHLGVEVGDDFLKLADPVLGLTVLLLVGRNTCLLDSDLFPCLEHTLRRGALSFHFLESCAELYHLVLRGLSLHLLNLKPVLSFFSTQLCFVSLVSDGFGATDLVWRAALSADNQGQEPLPPRSQHLNLVRDFA